MAVGVSMVQGLTVSVLTDWSGILVPNEIISGNPDYKSGLFCIFAPLFRRETRQRFFIEKKASFRLSVSVNLDNSRMLVRISEIKLT